MLKMDYANLTQLYVFASVAQRSKAAVMDSFATLGKTRSCDSVLGISGIKKAPEGAFYSLKVNF
jgi:hypothetical protein